MQPLPWQQQAKKKYRSVLFFREKGSTRPFTLISFDGSHISTSSASELIRQRLCITERTNIQLENARTEKILDNDGLKLPSYTYLLYSLTASKDEERKQNEPTMIAKLIKRKGLRLSTNPDIRRIAKVRAAVSDSKLDKSVIQLVRETSNVGEEENLLSNCGCCGFSFLKPVQTKCCQSILCATCCEYLSWEFKSCPLCEAATEGIRRAPAEKGVAKNCYPYDISPDIFRRAHELSRVVNIKVNGGDAV